MALIQVSFVSQCLFRSVPIQVILPVDKISFDGSPVPPPKPFKTLYLLHGLLGSCGDWVSGTRIQRWAEERDLAVVMPSGDNHFYLDQPAGGDRYGQYIGEELVEITRRMFPLSRRREDTFIGGLSMGGYGAVRNGLKYHETFSHIIGLSSALHILEDAENAGSARISFEESNFGPLNEAVSSDRNPRVLIERLVRENAELPRIYLACGTGDSLIDVNRAYRKAFEDAGFDITWAETDGGHTWDLWDDQIHRALDWLPLKMTGQGRNSGNVGV